MLRAQQRYLSLVSRVVRGPSSVAPGNSLMVRWEESICELRVSRVQPVEGLQVRNRQS